MGYKLINKKFVKKCDRKKLPSVQNKLFLKLALFV